MKEAISEKELFIRMIVSAWDLQNTRVGKLLETLSDEQLMSPTAPGRNRGIYLIGHLTAVSDAMCPLLGWGERLYPELEKIFVSDPDNAAAEMPGPAEVRKYWTNVNEVVSRYIRQTQPEEWFTKHTAVTAEDFAKEPHRNKLNVLISRTNHHSYHYGQLVYLGKKKGQ